MNILDKIVVDIKEDLQILKQLVPVESLRVSLCLKEKPCL